MGGVQRRRNACYYSLILSLPLAVALLSQIRLLLGPGGAYGEHLWEEATATGAAHDRAVGPGAGDSSDESSANGLSRFEKKNDPQPCSGTALPGWGCLEGLAASMARVWTPKPIQAWCPPDEWSLLGRINNATSDGGDQREWGLILIKVPKSASSTAAGMALHVSHRRHQSKARGGESHAEEESSSCPVAWEHGLASTRSNREWSRSFLFAPIRYPVDRALSDVYFHAVSLRRTTNVDPAEAFVVNQLRRIPDNFIVRYTALRSTNDLEENSHNYNNHSGSETRSIALRRHVRQIVQEYDFLLVVDRLLESVVVLAHVTNTSWLDWMTLPSKTSGSWHRPAGHSRSIRCTRLVPPPSLNAKPRIRAYVEQEEWKARHAGDLLLYHAANRSLDMTIDAVGREWVMRHVQQAREFQSHVRRACANETFFPCSDDGTAQLDKSRKSCYARDFGCGHACVRRIAAAWGAARAS